jgi:hypothetical protein
MYYVLIYFAPDLEPGAGTENSFQLWLRPKVSAPWGSGSATLPYFSDNACATAAPGPNGINVGGDA